MTSQRFASNKRGNSALSRRRVTQAWAASLLASWWGLGRAQTPPGDPTAIRFGQSAPLTGSLAQVGLAFRDATRAVFGEVNAQGGVDGRKLELITLDDENRSERTGTNVKLLASAHRVAGLFGFVGAGAHRAGARAAAAEGLPYIAAASGAQELRAGTLPWIYNMRASHVDEIEAVVRHMKRIGLNRISLVFEYNSEGWEVRDALVAMIEKSGDRVASMSSLDKEGSDFSLSGAVSTVLAGKPQTILLGADSAASARFVTTARQAGFTGTFYTLSNVGGTALIDKLGPQAVGLSVTQVVPFPWTHSTRVGRDFQAFCVRTKTEPSFASMEAYLASTLLVSALRRVRELSPAKLAAALDTLSPHDFGGYLGTFYSTTRRGPGQVELTVYSSAGRFLK